MRRTSKHTNRLQAMISGEYKTFNLSKKLVMDTLKLCAGNVRRMALEVFDNNYKNYRGQADFLRRIVRNGGHLKLNIPGKVVVNFSLFNVKAATGCWRSF